MKRSRFTPLLVISSLLFGRSAISGQEPSAYPVPVAGQPLAANVTRLRQALDFLGTPLPASLTAELAAASKEANSDRLQGFLDPQGLFVVELNPESRLKVKRGLAKAVLQQSERWVGDTVTLHGRRSEESTEGGLRRVEIVMNGIVAASKEIPADGRVHELQFELPVRNSAWIALRHFPQLHTNPVNVLVAGAPIRASQRSALWCIETIEKLWRVRSGKIAMAEREEARQAFDQAIEKFHRIAAESPAGS